MRKYLDFMTGLQLVRQLPPLHENLSKRQVKAPEYFYPRQWLVALFISLCAT